MPASTSAPAGSVRELVRAASTARDDRWGEGMPPALSSGTAVERLLLDYFAHTAPDDLADRAPAELLAAVASHVRCGAVRRPGTTIVRIVDGPSSGAGRAGRPSRSSPTTCPSSSTASPRR